MKILLLILALSLTACASGKILTGPCKELGKTEDGKSINECERL